MMPLDVLHVLGSAQPEGTGVVRIVRGLAAELDPSKYRTHVCFLESVGPLVGDFQAAGVPVVALDWWTGGLNPLGAFRFWKYLRGRNFAVVHQHFGARAVRQVIRRASDARVVLHLHGLVLESAIIQGADQVIAASQAIARGVPNLKPIVIYGGVALPEEPANHLPEGAGIVIGAACRITVSKGLADLIRAFATLSHEFPDLSLEIAGDGPQRRQLENEVRQTGMGDRVRFLGWQRHMDARFARWDIFAMPSLDEGFGMAVIEAMASALPVVGTNVGGLPEIIENDHTGYLVNPSDHADLANHLRLLIGNAERRLAMGIAGRERIRACFGVKKMAGATAAVYDSVLRK